jgi:glycosyltransferase involved in cell wall biosynthesis
MMTNTSPHKTVVVIPVYDHEHAIGAVVQAVLRQGLPCILVDGSSASCARVLQDIAAAHADRVTLLVHAVNQGKGGAVMTECATLPQPATATPCRSMPTASTTATTSGALSPLRETPGAVINGKPIYDESVPKGRLYARYLTHVGMDHPVAGHQRLHVRIPSLSAGADGAADEQRPYRPPHGLRYRDPVRLYWRGLQVRNLSTRVRYPTDGVSHFRVWLDNALISRMHARLFAGMLVRAPLLLARRLRRLAGAAC